MRKYKANPNLGIFYKIKGQSRSERPINCSGFLWEIKEQDHSMQCGFLDRVGPGLEKGHKWNNCPNMNKVCNLHLSIVLISIDFDNYTMVR